VKTSGENYGERLQVERALSNFLEIGNENLAKKGSEGGGVKPEKVWGANRGLGQQGAGGRGNVDVCCSNVTARKKVKRGKIPFSLGFAG